MYWNIYVPIFLQWKRNYEVTMLKALSITHSELWCYRFSASNGPQLHVSKNIIFLERGDICGNKLKWSQPIGKQSQRHWHNMSNNYFRWCNKRILIGLPQIENRSSNLCDNRLRYWWIDWATDNINKKYTYIILPHLHWTSSRTIVFITQAAMFSHGQD